MLKHLELNQCDSTQDELERHLEGLNPTENLLISTSKQLKGRGRGAHTWDHLTGALAFSFTASPHPALTWQALEVAVCLADFIKQELQVQVDLKWPNDLYRNGKKCGGILLKSKGQRMLIGVGINLSSDDHWGHVLDHTDHLPMNWQHSLPKKFVEFYLQHHPIAQESLRGRWNQQCVHLAKIVTITDGDQVTHGKFLELGKHGEAIVETANGNLGIFNGTLRWQN